MIESAPRMSIITPGAGATIDCITLNAPMDSKNSRADRNANQQANVLNNEPNNLISLRTERHADTYLHGPLHDGKSDN